MPNTLSSATGRVWQKNAPPGVSETSAELNNFFYDTSAGILYNCTGPTAGIQTWTKFPSLGSVTQYAMVYYDGASLVSSSAGTIGQVPTSSGSGAAPTLQTPGSSSAIITGINAKNTGQTTLLTVPAGVTFYPQMLRVIATTATVVSVPAILSVGTSAGSYIDVLPLTTLTALNATQFFQNYPLLVGISSLAAGSVIAVNIGTGATATTLTLSVQIIGSYL